MSNYYNDSEANSPSPKRGRLNTEGSGNRKGDQESEEVLLTDGNNSVAIGFRFFRLRTVKFRLKLDSGFSD